MVLHAVPGRIAHGDGQKIQLRSRTHRGIAQSHEEFLKTGSHNEHAQCTFLSSQLIKNLAISALFFSDIIWCPLPGRPTSSSLTYSVFTPAWLSHLATQWAYGR